ncbi:unnamed protein product [Toxocara canis]|uniref:40S ribosomal protein S6 n=1 Tax=Toxocara canis TaxID=6265 RepID=A0A183U841_TOXCA|nr:unnamed protein product [Toxocara canis]
MCSLQRGSRGKHVLAAPMKATRGPRSELKNPEQILKQRRKKASMRAYQAHRREENLKKKKNRAGAIGQRKGMRQR